MLRPAEWTDKDQSLEADCYKIETIDDEVDYNVILYSVGLIKLNKVFGPLKVLVVNCVRANCVRACVCVWVCVCVCVNFVAWYHTSSNHTDYCILTALIFLQTAYFLLFVNVFQTAEITRVIHTLENSFHDRM